MPQNPRSRRPRIFPVLKVAPRLICVILLVLSACDIPSSDLEPARDDQALVVVDGTKISVQDFERTYVATLISSGSNDTRENRDLHLANLIDSELLYREALRRGMQSDPQSVVFTERARKKALGGEFFEKAFLETLSPMSDAEIRRAFARSKEKVVVRHLFFRDSLSAQEAAARLDAGADFLEEARRNYNLAEIDPDAGYLGPISYFNVDDSFAEAAFDLAEIGDYSEPVRSRVGYHIIRLENRVLTPIITESEYQTKKDGVSSQARLRKRRLEGDRFVRDYMQALNVAVNAESINALNAELELLENSVTPDNVELMRPEDLVLPVTTEDLTPETPLAQYTFHGENRMFTAQEYGFWLPDLNFAEARHRTAASVGRALRNEVFALEGLRLGLENDSDVKLEVEYQQRIHLAERLRDELKTDTTVVIEDTTIAEIQGRMMMSEEDMESMSDLIAPYLAEYQLLRRLRSDAIIEVDTTLFREIADLEH